MLERAADRLRAALGRLRDGHAAAAHELPTSGTRDLGPRALDALGLHSQPFAAANSAETLYVDDAIRMQVNILTQHLADGEVLPLLKGEAGSGRTSVLIRLMAEQGEAMHFFVARGFAALTAERAMRDMLRMLVRPIPQEADACYRELARQLRRLTGDGRPAVLVIDDADQLDDDELQHLLGLHDALRRHVAGGFRLLVVGGPAFEARLAALDSDQLGAGRMIATDVRPLPRPRVSAYLQHRLASAGAVGFPFSDADLDRIFAATGGLPAAVEVAAAALLEARYGRRE